MAEALEGVERFVELANAGEYEKAVAYVQKVSAPDVEFRPVLGVAIDGRTFHGPEEVGAYFRDLFETFETFTYGSAELRPISDEVVLLLTTVEAIGRGSGAATRQDIGIVIETKDGLIRRATAHASPDEARAAAEALVA